MGFDHKSLAAKRFLSFFCFLALFIVLFIQVQDVFREKWIEFETTSDTYIIEGFYDLDQHDVDVFFLGNSQIVRGISCMELLEKAGISSYSLATSNQPLIGSYFFLKEIVKKADPKVVFLEPSMLYSKIPESTIHMISDSSPWSKNKMDLILDYTSFYSSLRGDKKGLRLLESFLFPIMQYHERWDDQLSEADFTYRDLNTHVFRGSSLRPQARNLTDSEFVLENKISDDVHPDALDIERRYLVSILDYCRDNNICLVLIKTPRSDWTTEQHDEIQRYADEYDIDFLDFNSAELFYPSAFDTLRDFCEGKHLNIRGAHKLSDQIGLYINDHFDLEAKTYTEEDQEVLPIYNTYVDDFMIRSAVDIEDFLSLLENPEFEIVMQCFGNVVDLNTFGLSELVNYYGVESPVSSDKPFSAFFRDGKCVFSGYSEKNQTFKGRTAKRDKVELKVVPGEKKCTIKFGDQSFDHIGDGLYFLIFDSRNNKMIREALISYDDNSGKWILV